MEEKDRTAYETKEERDDAIVRMLLEVDDNMRQMNGEMNVNCKKMDENSKEVNKIKEKVTKK